MFVHYSIEFNQSWASFCLGVPAGTLVVSGKSVNAFLKEEHETVRLSINFSTCAHEVLRNQPNLI